MQQRNRAHHIEPATLIHSSNETTYWQRTIAYQTATAESAQALTLRLAAHIDVVLRGRASEEMKPIVRQLAAAIVVRHLRNPRSTQGIVTCRCSCESSGPAEQAQSRWHRARGVRGQLTSDASV